MEQPPNQMPSSHAMTGFNWPAAGRVYLAHWNQQSVTTGDPARPFRVARALGLPLVRVFIGDDVTIATWKDSPASALDDTGRMFDDAEAHGVKLVVSDYLTKETVEVLAGQHYSSWREAQADLGRPDSAANTTFRRWKQAVLGRLASHPAAHSWEVTNEPGYMLGIDAGAVSYNQGVHFLDRFHRLMRDAGAKALNGGGAPLWDTTRLSDDQLITYASHLDILDNHIYPPDDEDGNPIGGRAEAQAEINKTNAYFTRVRQLTGRAAMPGMLGEFSTQPSSWFTTLAQQSMSHGWTTLGWGYDAHDRNGFNDMQHPEVLDYLANLTLN